MPVEAPDGTIANAEEVSEKISASTVGLPLLSNTCRPLIFLIFDVEVIFLFPRAVVFKDLRLLALIEMGIFLIILSMYSLNMLWVAWI